MVFKEIFQVTAKTMWNLLVMISPIVRSICFTVSEAIGPAHLFKQDRRPPELTLQGNHWFRLRAPFFILRWCCPIPPTEESISRFPPWYGIFIKSRIPYLRIKVSRILHPASRIQHSAYRREHIPLPAIWYFHHIPYPAPKNQISRIPHTEVEESTSRLSPWHFYPESRFDWFLAPPSCMPPWYFHPVSRA